MNALITAETERAIAQLIEEHGIDKVNAALEPLISQFTWDDWQRVSNLADRLNRRIQANRAKSDAVK